MKSKVLNIASFSTQFNEITEEGIKDVAVITAGEARGWDMWIDGQFLADVVRQGNDNSDGIKSRFGHPSLFDESLGTIIGKFTNFRLSGDDKVIGDFKFITTEYNKDMIQHIITLSKEYPKGFGTSIVFEFELDEHGYIKVEQKDGKSYVGLGQLRAVDFVDNPAANPDGLFSEDEQLNKLMEKVEARLSDRTTSTNDRLSQLEQDVRLLYNIFKKIK
jgi:hypothetical protein